MKLDFLKDRYEPVGEVSPMPKPDVPQPQTKQAPQNTSPQPPGFPPNREVREGDLRIISKK
jgi:hypothetical protein